MYIELTGIDWVLGSDLWIKISILAVNHSQPFCQSTWNTWKTRKDLPEQVCDLNGKQMHLSDRILCFIDLERQWRYETMQFGISFYHLHIHAPCWHQFRVTSLSFYSWADTNPYGVRLSLQNPVLLSVLSFSSYFSYSISERTQPSLPMWALALENNARTQANSRNLVIYENSCSISFAFWCMPR